MIKWIMGLPFVSRVLACVPPVALKLIKAANPADLIPVLLFGLFYKRLLRLVRESIADRHDFRRNSIRSLL